eukprot:TRINITY_DN7146_c0_g3_i4.p2 TRINITY_DN7146_c0_g3~~TRINITY_DN7146_c0_g3_i4.p2  ORF type:complete len:117 (-),score=11.79 TRINITY_DN7146_c0_g3_i4:460-810(-)
MCIRDSILACICCPSWFGYFCFIHDIVKTCNICVEVLQQAKSTLFKILFFVFMCIIGCEIVNFIFCIFSCIHVWDKPCAAFKVEQKLEKAFHVIVYEENCETEQSVKNCLMNIFAK